MTPPKQKPKPPSLRLIRRDSPAISIVQSDFVILNERLAELYGIPGIIGCEMRPVTLPADSTRGGFLTQASVMKVTANGLTTSPVIRGAWILERILGDEPSVPPPNVGSIEPDTRGVTTVREQLEKHREIEACASCHREIDPPGFAMENFDVMGGWRDRYRTTEKGETEKRLFASREISFKRGPEVDASGETPEGLVFSGFREYRRYLANREVS